jgi:hypothetical protein
MNDGAPFVFARTTTGIKLMARIKCIGFGYMDKEMFDKEIKSMQDILVNEQNFSKIWDYFMSNFAENPRFMKYCKKTKHPNIKNLIETIGKKHMFPNQKINITHLFLLKVKRTKLVHGPFMINNCPGMVFYFDDINKGLITVATKRDMASYYRISTMTMSNDQGILPIDDSINDDDPFLD